MANEFLSNFCFSVEYQLLEPNRCEILTVDGPAGQPGCQAKKFILFTGEVLISDALVGSVLV
jgi:hypothetical protein